MGSKLSVQNSQNNGASSGHGGTGTSSHQRQSHGLKSSPEDMKYSRQPMKSSGDVSRRSSPITSTSMCSYSTTSTSQSSYAPEISHRPSQHAHASHRFTRDQQRRIMNAERILGEIAHEYTRKRAAGLVPTIPVPARTLLWEEMARNATRRVAERGQCVYGRDRGTLCGCTTYYKKMHLHDPNPGGICANCHHGGPWHRLTGGNNLRSSHMSWKSRYSQRMSEELYSASEASESESDEEAIANEVAQPFTIRPRYPRRSSMDRSSMTSNLSARLSSDRMNVQTLMKAMETYREQGMNEEEIEQRIQQEYPPISLRLSHVIGPTS